MPPALQQAAAAYWTCATSLMRSMMALTEVALDLPVGHFDESFSKPGTLLRLAWYPSESIGESQAIPVGQWRYGAHTDYDGFTILQRVEGSSGEGIGGLEIKMPSGEWVPMPAPKGTLTINIGDLLARWTNDRWKATPHRVAPPRPGAGSRLSLVYFTGPHPETLVERLPSQKCGEGIEAPRYGSITAREHVDQKVNAACAGCSAESAPQQP